MTPMSTESVHIFLHSSFHCLVYISKVGVLLIRLILESMDERLIVRIMDALSGQPVSLLVLMDQIPA